MRSRGRAAPSAIYAGQIPTLPTPRPAEILIPTDRRERLTARPATLVQEGGRDDGRRSPFAMALPILAVRHRLTGAAPRTPTVRLLPLNRELLERLDVAAVRAPLLSHANAVSHPAFGTGAGEFRRSVAGNESARIEDRYGEPRVPPHLPSASGRPRGSRARGG